MYPFSVKGHKLLCSNVFDVKVKVQLNSRPQLVSTGLTLQLKSSNNELLCSDVFTVKVKIQLNSRLQLASNLC